MDSKEMARRSRDALIKRLGSLEAYKEYMRSIARKKRARKAKAYVTEDP